MDIQSRRLLRTFKGHTHGVCLAFSPNSRYVASGSRDRSIQIWDVQKQLPTPKPVKVLGKGEILPVHAIAWSPDGKLIAAGDIAELKDLIDTALNRLGETDRKVVESFLESGSTEQTAILFIISTRSVQRVIKIFRESLEALGLGGE